MLKVSLITATAIISATLLGNQTVKAATVAYNFQVNIDFGALKGNTYNGNFTYNNATLIGVSTETTPLSTFNLLFNGNSYTQSDDPTSVASFLNGTFLGIDYAVTPPPSPTFVSGTINASDASFFYDLGTGTSGSQGTGVITYSPISAAVPEPLTILGSLTALGLGNSFKRRLVSKKCN